MDLTSADKPTRALEGLVDWIPAAIVVIDADQRITAASTRAAELFGYQPGEMVGRQLGDLVPHDVRDFHQRATDAYLAKPYVRHPVSGLQLRGLHRDGNEFPVDIALNTVPGPQGARFMAVITAARDRVELEVAEERRRHMVDFLTAVSHDLRTPLNAVLGFSELLASGAHGPLNDRQKRDVQNIRRSGESMLALLNDVLDLQRVETGRIQLLFERVRVSEVVEEVVSQEEPRAAQKGLPLEARVGGGIYVLSDRRRLRQVLGNLLSNAVKYTDAGRVQVSAEPSAGRVGISVADTGPGIGKSDLEKIFDPFFQGSLALRQAKSGAGLGLALTKRLVEALNGEIAVVSSLGVGTTAKVLLPAA